MSSPRITVIVATYNWSAVLRHAIESVLAQTERDFELLVVGDCCTDDSAQVVAGFTDPRVRWINLPENYGHQSGPNNRGLEEARGEFIAYLGHDDLWLPHHLECLSAALEKTQAAMAYCLVGRILTDEQFTTPVLPQPTLGSWSPPTGTMHRRSVTQEIGGWGNYRDLLDPPEIDLWRRAAAAGHQFAFVPRLSALKFPASKRKNVYREKPCHEQAAWLNRIRSEPDLEVTQLMHMITSGDVVRATPARQLLPIIASELKKRFLWRMEPTSGVRWLFFRTKGAGVAPVRTFKGL